MDRPGSTFAAFALKLGEENEFMFEQLFDLLYRRGLDTATPQEMALTLGVAIGTIGQLRRRLANLEEKNHGENVIDGVAGYPQDIPVSDG